VRVVKNSRLTFAANAAKKKLAYNLSIMERQGTSSDEHLKILVLRGSEVCTGF